MENKLKYFRKQKGITLEKLSELSNISMGYICHLELGSRSNPSYDIMKRIAVALGKKITDVFML